MSSPILAALASLVLVLSVAVPVARAETCAPEPVTARGEPARFQWLAKSKARANWRREVRETSTLGSAYANWKRALNAEERCFSGPEGTVCIFTGYPCTP